jgi:formylglycine-generating enzyme required for sulfatase activity/tRNA A-37 threonylcarbamoyl transferase component Bud32
MTGMEIKLAGKRVSMAQYQPGDLVNKNYRIEAFLGEGSFAEVYRAIYLPFKQERALKILKRDVAGLSAAEYALNEKRFRMEYMLSARLNSPNAHPHLLNVHEPLLAEDLLGVAMEYAPGGNLKSRIEKSLDSQKPLAVEACLTIARDVALGLGRLHDYSIVHRDIKPANILFDQDGRARVGDLGLVQTEDDMSDRLQKSNPAPHPGTPGYKSPEQVESLEPLKTSSDVYGLGLVLFEMLTGRKYALQRAGIRARELRPDLTAEVDILVARLLSKNPDERPNDGREAAQLLEGCMQALQSPPEKPAVVASVPRQAEAAQPVVSPESKGVPWLRTWPVLVVAGLVVLGLLRLIPFGGAPAATEAPAVPTAVPVIATQTNVPTEAPTATLMVPTSTALPTAVPTATPYPVEITEQGAKMRLVPAGMFTMGSDVYDEEKPAHSVSVAAFYMDVYEVTNGLYQACVSAGGCSAPRGGGSYTHSSYYGNPEFEQYPVIYVDWEQAQSYCAWRSARLPGEAEWEYAARGSDGRIYPWGNTIDSSYANYYSGTSGDKDDTSPVGTYEKGKSPFGMYDMAGNVWEWTADWYQAYPGNTVADSAYGQKYRVLRGGAWDDDDVSNVRTALRSRADPTGTDGDIGFRCARSR